MPTKINYSDTLLEYQLTTLLSKLQNGELTQSEKIELWERLNGVEPDPELVNILFTGWFVKNVLGN